MSSLDVVFDGASRGAVGSDAGMALADGGGDRGQLGVGHVAEPGEEEVVSRAVGLGVRDFHRLNGSTVTAVP